MEHEIIAAFKVARARPAYAFSLARSRDPVTERGECARVRAQGRGKKSVVKPRLQIYDIELEVEGGPLEAGANKI